MQVDRVIQPQNSTFQALIAPYTSLHTAMLLITMIYNQIYSSVHAYTNRCGARDTVSHCIDTPCNQPLQEAFKSLGGVFLPGKTSTSTLAFSSRGIVGKSGTRKKIGNEKIRNKWKWNPFTASSLLKRLLRPDFTARVSVSQIAAECSKLTT